MNPDAPMPPEAHGPEDSAPTPGIPTPPLSCEDAWRLMECLLDEGGFLKETERRLLFLHLRGCSSCKAHREARRRLDTRLREALSGLDTAPGFTRQVLRTLPAAGGLDTPAGSRETVGTENGSRVRQVSPEAEPGRRSFSASARRFALPIAMAATIALAVFGAWWRHGIVADPAQSPPILSRLKGSGRLLRRNRERPLKTDTPLRKGDLVVAGLAPAHPVLVLGLSSGGRPLASIRLKAGAKLRVQNRHHYILQQGEAYFDVFRERPRAADEWFDVETPLGHVQVTGTRFGVIVPSGAPQKITVVVDEGRVKVRPLSGAGFTLQENEEGDLLAAGGAVGPRPAAQARLSWVRSPSAAPSVAQAPDPSASNAPLPPRGRPTAPGLKNTATPLDWSTLINAVNFRGRRLPDALENLSVRLGGSAELQTLARRAGALRASFPKSKLVVRQPLPLATVVRWLAREGGLRFGHPPALRKAQPGERLGPPEKGDPPARLAGRLASERFPPPSILKAGSLAHARATGWSPEEELEKLAQQHGLNLLVEAAGLPAKVRRWPAPGAGRVTFQAALDALVLAAGLEWAYYDGLIYVARPERIEQLTYIRRRLDAVEWAGAPLQPEWGRSLTALAARLRERPDGTFHLAPSGRLVVEAVALQPDEPMLHFTAGRAGQRALERALALIRRGSPTAPTPAVVLDEQRIVGAVRNFAELARRAQQRHVPVELKVEPPAFPSLAFVSRSLPLGRALDWAARLQGLGVRQDAGRLLVDRWAACYGAPELQVLDLSPLHRPLASRWRELPQRFARLVQASYPELFQGVAFYALQGRLAFNGERRQLAAAQRVLLELERGVRALKTGQAFDLKSYRPAWQKALARNLAEPFRGDGSGALPAGSFAWLLRRSGLFAQLRSTLLVDPQAMKKHAAQRIPRLEVRGLKLGQVLKKLARSVNLRMVLEDGVVWLRE